MKRKYLFYDPLRKKREGEQGPPRHPMMNPQRKQRLEAILSYWARETATPIPDISHATLTSWKDEKLALPLADISSVWIIPLIQPSPWSVEEKLQAARRPSGVVPPPPNPPPPLKVISRFVPPQNPRAALRAQIPQGGAHTAVIHATTGAPKECSNP